MSVDEAVEVQKMRPEVNQIGEQQMIDEERWRAIRRRHFEDKVSISALARVIFRHKGATRFSAYWSHRIFGVMAPLRFRHIGATPFSA